MIWEELLKTALIGAERAALPEKTLEALSRLGVDTDGDAPGVLLEGAALYFHLRRAGFPLSAHEGVQLPLPGEEEAAGKPLSGAAARHLQLILEGRFPNALPEYLQLLKKHHRRVPPEHLPTLFYYAQRQPALWKVLQGLITPFGRWLLRQNPEWASLADDPNVEAWPGATFEERLGMLRYVRRLRPEEAAPLLESGWETHSHTEKLAFLQEAEAGLGPYDEAFLENCLQDRRREVRSAAARLLALLPGSALQQRLFSHARDLFGEEEGKGLAVQLPEKLDEGLERDGIGGGRKNYPGGKAAGWVFEILSRIPPRRWEEHFNRPVVDIIRLLAGSNRKALLLDALANAAVLHHDHRWTEAILRYWWRTDDEEAWPGSQAKLLMENLPDPVFNEIALQYLRQNPGFIEEKSLLSQLLCRGAHYWENQLAQLVIKGFQQWLSGARAYYWNLWHYKRILEVAAYRIDPGLLESFRSGWDARSPVWYRWEKEVERFLKVLAFRKEMREALVKEI